MMAAIDRLIAPVSQTAWLEKLMLDYFIFKDFELPQTNKKGCVHIVPEYEPGVEREVFGVEPRDELIDKIIDDISDEAYPTFEACSMVCRAWRPRATRRLFRAHHTLFLTRSHTNERIHSSPLYIAFSNPPSYPASFITTITISGISRISMLKSVLGCLCLYPKLQELLLWEIDFFKLSLSKTEALSQDFNPISIRQLKLRDVTFTDTTQLVAFVRHFSNLSVLGLRGIVKYGSQRGKIRRWPWSFHTTELVVKRSLVSSSLSFPELLRGVSEDYQSTDDPYLDILNILGKSTTHLVLRGSVASHFNPELFPSLTHLSLDVDFNLKRSEQLETLASTPSRIKVIYLYMLGGYGAASRVFSSFKYSDQKRVATMSALDQLLVPLSRMPLLEKLALGRILFQDHELQEANKKGCVCVVPEFELWTGAEKKVFLLESS
ncbi:hypothetical protein VKT23_009352 [Stygiomarasmius scandens]|uniref:F-box domain-containing protein n=1 Tax=Marasmiellus scandens TaxID=2682957 RepID=A0ABR1JJU6_9AGAR